MKSKYYLIAKILVETSYYKAINENILDIIYINDSLYQDLCLVKFIDEYVENLNFQDDAILQYFSFEKLQTYIDYNYNYDISLYKFLSERHEFIKLKTIINGEYGLNIFHLNENDLMYIKLLT